MPELAVNTYRPSVWVRPFEAADVVHALGVLGGGLHIALCVTEVLECAPESIAQTGYPLCLWVTDAGSEEASANVDALLGMRV